MHTSTTFLPPPSLSCFQTSVESCVPLSHLLSKVTIKDAEYVCVLRRVRWLLRKNFDWQTLSGDPEGLRSHCKRFIGKMHPRMLLGGSCPGAIIEWPLRAWLPLTFPPVNKLTSFKSGKILGRPARQHYSHRRVQTQLQIQNRARVSEGRKVPSLGKGGCAWSVFYLELCNVKFKQMWGNLFLAEGVRNTKNSNRKTGKTGKMDLIIHLFYTYVYSKWQPPGLKSRSNVKNCNCLSGHLRLTCEKKKKLISMN